MLKACIVWCTLPKETLKRCAENMELRATEKFDLQNQTKRLRPTLKIVIADGKVKIQKACLLSSTHPRSWQPYP
jgi:hypothetical protein